MLSNIKNRLISVIAPDVGPLPSASSSLNHAQQRGIGYGGGGGSSGSRSGGNQVRVDKFAYARPPFLQLLTQDELRASADHGVRPIIVPRDTKLLPWGTGYAECVNSGKSEWNEDQAAFCRQVLSDPTHRHPDMPYTYFGIFDGHAGYGAALAASHQFHHILHEKLIDCIEMLLPRDEEHAVVRSSNGFPHPSQFQRRVNKDELIVGALESAFFDMDSLIEEDRNRYRDAGGCTACVSLFINGKMYVANAGDSRAVLCLRRTPNNNNSKTTESEKKPKDNSQATSETSTAATNTSSTTTAAAASNGNGNGGGSSIEPDTLGAYPVPFSFDHTPETERQRLLNVAKLQPYLLECYYVAMEYARRPHNKNLGQRILCRQGTMKGWTYKTLTHNDLLMPVVMGEGKRSRLLGTLGVTRGFGDHDLLAINTGTRIKPFLTPQPEVNYRDLSKIVSIPDEHNEDGDYGILVMATDGLWDVSENETVARTVFHTLHKYSTERHRYTMVAQELVARARGKINDSGHWRLADSKAAATVDDISVIVIPVYQYYKEHVEWERKSAAEWQERLRKEPSQALEAHEDESTPLVNGAASGVATATTLTREEHAANEAAAVAALVGAHGGNDDDDEEEEIVVEINKQTVHAQIEVEPDVNEGVHKDDSATATVTATATAAKTEGVSNSSDVDATIDATANALAAAVISTTNTTPTKETTAAESGNKSVQQQQQQSQQQQQQQHNRKRKDKR